MEELRIKSAECIGVRVSLLGTISYIKDDVLVDVYLEETGESFKKLVFKLRYGIKIDCPFECRIYERAVQPDQISRIKEALKNDTYKLPDDMRSRVIENLAQYMREDPFKSYF